MKLVSKEKGREGKEPISKKKKSVSKSSKRRNNLVSFTKGPILFSNVRMKQQVVYLLYSKDKKQKKRKRGRVVSLF